MDRFFVSIEEACKLLSVGRTKIYELLSEGSLQKRKIGRRTLITVESLKAFCDEGRR